MSLDLRQMLESLLQQAASEIGMPPKKTRITFRMWEDPEPVVELSPGEEVMHIVLVPLERPARSPMPDLGADRRSYGEAREPDLEVETPDTLERMMEQMKNAGF